MCPHCGRPRLQTARPEAAATPAKRSASRRVPPLVFGLVVVVAVVIVIVAATTGPPDEPAESHASVPSGVVPGETIADSMLHAVKPRRLETVYTLDPDSPKKFLMDRLNDLEDAHAGWNFGQPEFSRTPGGPETSLTLQFRDGSRLTLFETPNPGRTNGLHFDSARVVP